MAINEKYELWKKHISGYRSSELSADEWCKQEKISISALRYWVTKFNKEQAKTNIEWVSYDEKLPQNINQENSEITLQVNKVIVKIKDHFSEETLLKILKVLGEYAI